jgi:Fur family ferric uptake transcriptional regulator
MCYRCDYTELLRKAGLDYTPHRLHVLETIGQSSSPLAAQEIFETMNRTQDVNRVTVYRILDLLVERKLVDRISTGHRAFHYGLAPNAHHPRHAHFHCTRCGSIECLNPGDLHVDMESLERSFPGIIEKVEIRLDGLCKTCLRLQRNYPTGCPITTLD